MERKGGGGGFTYFCEKMPTQLLFHFRTIFDHDLGLK